MVSTLEVNELESTDLCEPDYPPELKADLADDECMICETLFREHSQSKFERCMGEIVKKARQYPGIKPLRRAERGKHKTRI